MARWGALILIALMMFFAYMFVDVISPISSLLETQRGWSPDVYGTVVGSEYFLNVFVLFLIFAGIILDKMGVRFTGLLSAGLMIVGAGIKLYGISDYFVGGGFGWEFFNSFWPSMPGSAKVACIGFAIFGCGAEMAGVTVSRAIARWFDGKEMALAMGVEMAIARLGVTAVFFLSPRIADMAPVSVVRPVALVGALLCIGFLTFLVFTFMDRKLDRQMGNIAEVEEDQFKVKDLGNLFGSKTFMIVAFLCVLYYSAIFPFQKFAVPMLQNTLGITSQEASDLFAWFTIGAIILLGVSFSLVPAALWPSVPKLVDGRYLGSGYSVIFWIQNLGLWAFPLIIGKTLQATNPGVSEQIQAGVEGVTYNYTVPMLVFASLGVLAFFLGLWLKRLDTKNHYGLELPNVRK